MIDQNSLGQARRVVGPPSAMAAWQASRSASAGTRDQLVAKLRRAGFLPEVKASPSDAQILAAVDGAKHSCRTDEEAALIVDAGEALARKRAEEDALYRKAYPKPVEQAAAATDAALEAEYRRYYPEPH
jgi:hypothetical protein